MDCHDCQFSIVRLRSRYKGTDYEINECEECGALGLIEGTGADRRVMSKESAEFQDVVDVMDFIIRAIRK